MDKRSLMLAVMLLFGFSGYGAEVASFGGLYPVEEIDIRTVIFARLQQMQESGEMEEHQKRVTERVRAKLERPEPRNLLVSKTPKISYVDPSITVTRDIYNHEGKLVAAKGTTINPFDRVSYHKTLMFFDADDKKQLQFIEEQYKNHQQVTFILTGGSVKEGNKKFGRVYFDWNGNLSKRFGIQYAPAIVFQEGKKWKVIQGGVA